jgi:plastocyanin
MHHTRRANQFIRLLAGSLAAATVIAGLTTFAGAAGAAATYPASDNPQPPPAAPANSSTKTLHVCSPSGSKTKHCYTTIQKAVNAATAGDTIAVPPGTYRAPVTINGASKDYLKLVGSPKKPTATVINLSGLPVADRQDGIEINGADDVTLSGFATYHYLGNGFFADNAYQYFFENLVAGFGGTYGIYAFNSIGGYITHSDSFYNNDSGYYIGQTPVQNQPVQSFVSDVRSWGNVLGFSGTNMKYVTIEKSLWYDNGIGIVPNALDSEKYAPPEDNTIIDNTVFWNNYNYYKGAPFMIEKGADGLVYPIGIGVLLYGSRNTAVQENQIFGNYLAGFAEIGQVALKETSAASLNNNSVIGNVFGRGGKDPNGYDIAYPGSVLSLVDTGNCFSKNVLASRTLPPTAPGAAFGNACPYSGPNPDYPGGLATAVTWLADTTHQKFWVIHTHPAFEGLKPFTVYKKADAASDTSATPPVGQSAPVLSGEGASQATGPMALTSFTRAERLDSSTKAKVVNVQDDFFGPKTMSIKPGTTVEWKWSYANSDTHNVKMISGPKGVKAFKSPSGVVGITYKHTFTVKGTYDIICTFHQMMTMTIKVT